MSFRIHFTLENILNYILVCFCLVFAFSFVYAYIFLLIEAFFGKIRLPKDGICVPYFSKYRYNTGTEPVKWID